MSVRSKRKSETTIVSTFLILGEIRLGDLTIELFTHKGGLVVVLKIII